MGFRIEKERLAVAPSLFATILPLASPCEYVGSVIKIFTSRCLLSLVLLTFSPQINLQFDQSINISAIYATYKRSSRCRPSVELRSPSWPDPTTPSFPSFHTLMAPQSSSVACSHRDKAAPYFTALAALPRQMILFRTAASSMQTPRYPSTSRLHRVSNIFTASNGY